MKIPFILDPKSKIQSVSLTILVLATIIVVVAFGLDIAGVVEDTSISLEFFGISSALYFGRNMNLNGKSFSAVEQPEAVKEESK